MSPEKMCTICRAGDYLRGVRAGECRPEIDKIYLEGIKSGDQFARSSLGFLKNWVGNDVRVLGVGRILSEFICC